MRPAALAWWGPGVTCGPRCSKAVADAAAWLAYWKARARWSTDAADAVATAKLLGAAGHGVLAPLYTEEGIDYLRWANCEPGAEDYADKYPQYFTDTRTP